MHDVADGDGDGAAMPIEQLDSAAEVFLASSTRDIHPVHLLDGRELPAPGPAFAARRNSGG